MKNCRILKLISALIVGLVVGELLLVLVSWLLSALMVDGVHSLLSSEGVRWFAGSFSELLATPLLVNLLLLAMSGGCLWRSGLLQRPQSLRDKTALKAVLILMIVFVCVIILLTALPHAVLLSATGHLWPSPFSRALIPIITLSILLSAALYGTMSGRFPFFATLLESLSFGIAKAAPFILLYFVATVFYASLCYVCL